jgi:hypothetical protein
MERTQEFKETFGELHQLVRRAKAQKPLPKERCEMCSQPVPTVHQHLIEVATRRLVCTCGACSLLFGSQSGSKYKLVPRRVRFLPGFSLSDGQWESLMVPINMAFFFSSSVTGKVIALYPSPAGATESLLPLETWNEIVQENPLLADTEQDVEALLVNRLGSMRGYSTAEYYILPIDECYKLVGLIRSHWRGLSGGAEVWDETGKFFATLRKRSEPAAEVSRA